ncbi:hypothetical protein N7481_010554 [Penicillium waksmanii]|uniref:uncharacterized protein n=1 Tax=Penicillium waksmanii TaxID=69791 RepID=UPI002546D108|nr:uncharacterized protein N7481_010554 [Penicillium waksmanii]KAJ5973344.1 hypothetical protein N7481_010554 [Penicillium waksmanii]
MYFVLGTLTRRRADHHGCAVHMIGSHSYRPTLADFIGSHTPVNSYSNEMFYIVGARLEELEWYALKATPSLKEKIEVIVPGKGSNSPSDTAQSSLSGTPGTNTPGPGNQC